MLLEIVLRDGTVIRIHPADLENITVNGKSLAEILETDEVAEVRVVVE